MNLFDNILILTSVSDSTSEVVEETGTNSNSFEGIWNSIINWCKTDGIKDLIALIVLIICFIIVNCIAKGVRKGLRKSGKDESVCNLAFTLIRKISKFLLLIIFLGYLGLEMTGISSIIASLGVGVGLALQGSLANFAGWLIIIVTRPFKLGDYIAAQGESGTVEEINLIYTHLRTVDNKVILIPNGNLSNGNITNYSMKDKRRVDLPISISYDSDQEKAVEIIKNVIKANKMIFKDPEPFVRVTNYADSSVEITAKVWVKSENYWTVYFDLIEKVRPALESNDITIPYNQLDVNFRNMDLDQKIEAVKKAKKESTKTTKKTNKK